MSSLEGLGDAETSLKVSHEIVDVVLLLDVVGDGLLLDLDGTRTLELKEPQVFLQ
jgi:hypothetical protein